MRKMVPVAKAQRRKISCFKQPLLRRTAVWCRPFHWVCRILFSLVKLMTVTEIQKPRNSFLSGRISWSIGFKATIPKETWLSPSRILLCIDVVLDVWCIKHKRDGPMSVRYVWGENQNLLLQHSKVWDNDTLQQMFGRLKIFCMHGLSWSRKLKMSLSNSSEAIFCCQSWD